MPDALRCPQCGSMLSSGAASGAFCPSCLLTLALGEEPGTSANDSIGPYRIVETLGEGGMGVVYLAEQEHPIRRLVALKVIKVGMDTREVVARFESERQALALMDHPHIARVLDAGASADGRPYFVMEYVPGVPITEFCDQQQLSTDARLHLMRQVCAAVQHAHQRGIIHRDLKPSNVLVTMVDGEAVPKVIDFGVAKAIDQDVLARTLFTEHGRLVGTPEYMSPEQASLGAVSINTQTDIYSLGVMLYELLVGALPFEVATLRRAGYDEMRRIIREVDVPKPSTRVGTLGAKAGEAATCRRTHPVALQKKLRGDLDWIALKTLEKDPARRYASASELAADIDRHLRNEPVVASPPSATYRARKFALKHRTAVIVASLFVLVLLAAATLSTLLFLRAEAARREAERQRDAAERRAYQTNIVAADLSLAAGEVREARRLLELCPPRLRGWEWEYLHHIADASVVTLRAPAANDTARPIESFDAIDFVQDRMLAIGTRAGSPSNADALVEFGALGTASSAPSATPVHLDSNTSVLAVSGDGRRLLVTRWYGGRPSARLLPIGTEPASAATVELRVDNPPLTNRDRNHMFVIDARSGQTVATLTLDSVGVWRGRHGDANAIGLSPNIPWRGTASIVDSVIGRPVSTVGYPVAVRGVLNDDGSRAAIWSWDNVIHVWDVATSRPLAALTGHADFISRAVFTANSTRLVSGSSDATVRIWDLRAGRAVTVLGSQPTPIRTIAVASSGALVAAGFDDRIIRLWRDAKPMSDVLRGHTGPITALAFDRDGGRLVSASLDRTVRVWDTARTTELLTLHGHEDAVTAVAFSSDHRVIASSSVDGTIRLWNADAPLETLSENRRRQVRGVAFVDNGSAIVCGQSDDDVVRVWDLRSGGVVRQATLPGEVASLAIGADGRRLAVGLINRPTRNRPQPNISAVILDSDTLRTVATLTGQQGAVGSVAFSGDGTRLATASADGVWLWDAAAGREIRRWSGDREPLAVSLTRDGSLVAAGFAGLPGGHGGGLLVWPVAGRDGSAGSPVMTANSATATPAIAFTADASRIVSGGGDGLVRIWDVRSGQEIAALSGHDAAVQAVALSPDGRRIASAGADRTLRIWDTDTHDLLLTLRLTGPPVQRLAFSADGSRLAAGILTGTIRVWYSRPR